MKQTLLQHDEVHLTSITELNINNYITNPDETVILTVYTDHKQAL